MDNEVTDLAKTIAKEMTEEQKKFLEYIIVIIKQLTNEERQEFFKRLEKIIYEVKIILVAFFGSVALVISVWIICYFFSPYLSKNYAKVENGTVIQSEVNN